MLSRKKAIAGAMLIFGRTRRHSSIKSGFVLFSNNSTPCSGKVFIFPQYCAQSFCWISCSGDSEQEIVGFPLKLPNGLFHRKNLFATSRNGRVFPCLLQRMPAYFLKCLNSNKRHPKGASRGPCDISLGNTAIVPGWYLNPSLLLMTPPDTTNTISSKS